MTHSSTVGQFAPCPKFRHPLRSDMKKAIDMADLSVVNARRLKEEAEDRLRCENEEKTLAMLLKVARFRTAEIRAGFIRNHRKKAGEKMLGSLTEAQQKQFRKMQGEPFDTAGLDVE